MIWPRDELTYDGVVAGTHQEKGQRMVDIDLSCTRRDGSPVTLGWATFAVPG